MKIRAVNSQYVVADPLVDKIIRSFSDHQIQQQIDSMKQQQMDSMKLLQQQMIDQVILQSTFMPRPGLLGGLNTGTSGTYSFPRWPLPFPTVPSSPCSYCQGSGEGLGAWDEDKRAYSVGICKRCGGSGRENSHGM